MAFHASCAYGLGLVRARALVKHSGAPMSFLALVAIDGRGACALIAVVILIERQKHDG
jgi:hypothetical protein